MSAECLPVVGLTCRLLTGRLLIGCGGASGDVVWGPAPRVSSCQLPAVKIRDKTSALFFFLSKSSLSESAASLSINFVQFLTSLVQFLKTNFGLRVCTEAADTVTSRRRAAYFHVQTTTDDALIPAVNYSHRLILEKMRNVQTFFLSDARLTIVYL